MQSVFRRRRTLVASALFASAAIIAAGCGSPHSTSSNGSSSTTAGSSATSGTSGSGPSSGVATAQAAVTAAAALPATIPNTVPLNSAPPQGKTLVWTQCDAPQCSEITGFLQQAVAAAGWNLKVVDYQTANPATLVAALQQALQYRPAAVTLSSLPYVTWSSAIPAYQQAGVPLITYSAGPLTLTPTVPAEVVNDADSTLQGTMFADWFVADSNGIGHALLWSVPQAAPLAAFDSGFQNEVKRLCSSCTVSFLGEPYADVAAGKSVSTIVSTIQRDSSVRYVISSDQALTTPLTSALKAAGISGIKVAGANIEASDENLIKSGQEPVGIPTELNMVAWMIVDAALRHAEGMTIPSETIRWTLLTSSSAITPSNIFAYPPNWQQQFKTLWKVG